MVAVGRGLVGAGHRRPGWLAPGRVLRAQRAQPVPGLLPRRLWAAMPDLRPGHRAAAPQQFLDAPERRNVLVPGSMKASRSLFAI